MNLPNSAASVSNKPRASEWEEPSLPHRELKVTPSIEMERKMANNCVRKCIHNEKIIVNQQKGSKGDINQ